MNIIMNRPYNNILKNHVYSHIKNYTLKFGPDLVSSIIIFFVGSYSLSQHTIPSYLKESYTPIKWYIKHPANAWSSLLFSIPKTPLIMKLPLMTLSIASFSLWANSTLSVNFIDVTSIYWVIITTTIYSLPYCKNGNKIIWVINSTSSIFIASSIYTGFYKDILVYYNDNIVPFTGAINIICCIILYSYYLDNKSFNIAAFFVICGYICKLQTIYYNAYWGTSVFHVFTAIGIHILLYMDKHITKDNKIIVNKFKKKNSVILFDNI